MNVICGSIKEAPGRASLPLSTKWWYSNECYPRQRKPKHKIYNALSLDISAFSTVQNYLCWLQPSSLRNTVRVLNRLKEYGVSKGTKFTVSKCKQLFSVWLNFLSCHPHSVLKYFYYKKVLGTGEMDSRLTMAALPEDLGLIPSTTQWLTTVYYSSQP